MKTLRTFILMTMMLLAGNIAMASASDFKTIYKRMYDTYLKSNPSEKKVNELLDSMTPEGAFSDIDYTVTSGAPRKHVQNLIVLANAYQESKNKFYHDKTLKEAYLKSLRFWVDTDHHAANWWYRYIPYPKELSQGVILMTDEIRKDPELFEKTMAYLRYSYETAKPAHMTGANAADIIMGSLTASILTEDDAQMVRFRDQMTSLLTIQETEGVLRDYLYGQHCGNGRQLYFTSYGKEFVNSMLFYLEFCQGTKYQSPGLSLLQDLFIKGAQWIFFAEQYDPNNAGRYIDSNHFQKDIVKLARRVCQLSEGEVRTQMEEVVKRIDGENTLTGNRMFWRFDYMINRRTGYYASSRMTSTRTVGNEAGNGDGEFNYYAANGVNYIFVTGKEYADDFFKKFNNRQYPGITAEQDNEPLPIPDWGEHGNNGNAFAGGVSDSVRGACGMILDRRSLTAHKAWFYFDDEFVCLGTGIRNANGKADVYTTLNQCNADGKIQYACGKEVRTWKEAQKLKGLKWVLHGRIGYYNLDPEAEYRLACDNGLFTLNINHGLCTEPGTYAYAVRPNLKSVKEAGVYAQQLPIEILSNTEQLQAVRHRQQEITEAIFYQAGSLNLPDGMTLKADAPCTLMWNNKERKLHVANPYCESQNPASITVTLTIGSQSRTLTFDMPQGEFAGSTVAKIVK